MIFACNNLPRTYDTTDAFFRRWIVLQFPYKFKDEGDITEDDGNFVRVKDPNILDDLTSDEELRGLLRWALEGARRLRREGDFSYSKTTEDIRKYWFSKSDTFQAFASECLEKKPGFRINKEDLIKAYHLYCDEKNLSLVSDKNIKRIMRKEFGSTRTRTTQGGKKVYRFDNVKFRFDDQEFGGNRKYSDSDGLIKRLQHPDFSRNMSVDDVVLSDDGDVRDGDVVEDDSGVDKVSEDMSFGVKKKNLENYLSRQDDGKASIESLVEFGFSEDFLDKLLREGDLMENPSGYVRML
jgi:phage/plasmid-associated DNA primase